MRYSMRDRSQLHVTSSNIIINISFITISKINQIPSPDFLTSYILWYISIL